MQTPFRFQLSGLLALAAAMLAGPALGKGLDLVPMGVVEQAKSVTVDTLTPPSGAAAALAIPVPTVPAPAGPEVAAAAAAAPAVVAPAAAAPAAAAPAAVAPAAAAPAAVAPAAAAPAAVAPVAVAPAAAAPVTPSQHEQVPAATALIEAQEPHEQAEEVWHVPAHGTLRELMESWAERAGWRVVWDTDLDYPMEAPFEVRGDFVKAADAVFAAYWDAKEKFAVEAFPNNVLLVQQMGGGRK